MFFYPEALLDLINQLKKMPAIGQKSAERIAFYLLNSDLAESEILANSIVNAKKKIKSCPVCFNITDSDLCLVCSDPLRDQSVICVTSSPKEVIAIEKMQEFKGLYHVLGGVISPLDDISPDKLKIKELISRIKEKDIQEVIMVINPTIEGETTVIYLSKILQNLNLKITRIAYGLPVGGDIDYADELTLARAIEGRQEIKF